MNTVSHHAFGVKLPIVTIAIKKVDDTHQCEHWRTLVCQVSDCNSQVHYETVSEQPQTEQLLSYKVVTREALQEILSHK